jgi:hypothetical protein
MASLQTVYGGNVFSAPSSSQPMGIGMNSGFSIRDSDGTPMSVALMLLFWGGVLWLLRYYGFRFNFGVTGGK